MPADEPGPEEDDPYCMCAIGLACRINDFEDMRKVTPPPIECEQCDSTGYKPKDQEDE